MTLKSRQMARCERQQQLNLQLSALPTFIPLTDSEIYYINGTTSTSLMADLIGWARKTRRYTIDTEHDFYTCVPAFIQIEFLHSEPSIVLLIETCHLPPASSVLFWLIRSLLKIIFKPSNMLFSWGDLTFELANFIDYGLFSLNMIIAVDKINLQLRFKNWYNRTFIHTCGCLPIAGEDNLSCTCLHRPIKDRNHQWALQKAIAYTFNEFLDKNQRRTPWSQCLIFNYIHQYSLINNSRMKSIFDRRIIYAVNDCLAVTKLLMVIEYLWTKEELDRYNHEKYKIFQLTPE